MNKRAADQVTDMVLSVGEKRPRFEGDLAANIESRGKEVALRQQRKHHLKGPIMLLTGHDAEIFSCKFHPTGTVLASAGADRSIYLWSSRGDCENYAILKAAHSNTITDLAYSMDGKRLFSCGADKTVIMWDCTTGCRIKKLRNHHSYVNAIVAAPSDPNLLASVADDSYANIWDLRSRKCTLSFQGNYQLTSVSFDKTSNQLFVAGIENKIDCWDLKTGSIKYTMLGHSGTITGLCTSPDGQHLLSNSMDNTLKSWDISSKPSNPMDRHEKTFLGHQHNFEKNLLRCSWSPNGSMITAGSADRNVYVWSYKSGNILYKLPGHRGTVNEIVFSPREPLILSCSSDKQMYLGEINYDLT